MVSLTRSGTVVELLPASNIALEVPPVSKEPKNKHHISFGQGNKEDRWTQKQERRNTKGGERKGVTRIGRNGGYGLHINYCILGLLRSISDYITRTTCKANKRMYKEMTRREEEKNKICRCLTTFYVDHPSWRCLCVSCVLEVCSTSSA